ncbi:MAG: radical SAM family heme chaperone HemW [Stellaceae bacterium]
MTDIALYVHWPFCKSKCPYCDFNSHVRRATDERRWARALLAELDHWGWMTAGRRIVSVFFGGGTPSLMPPTTVAQVLERTLCHWHAASDLEVTLEANPTSVEAGRLQGFRAAGINRVSLGVQALDDRALRFLGREHDAAEARAAVRTAARIFPRYSFDLIYARPGQDVAQWERELEAALALAGEHLSVYQLTMELGTAMAAAHARSAFTLPDGELAGALYEATAARLERAGLPAYEISNHARPGGECRHNLAYWRSGDYVGIGPGAHGRLTSDGQKLAIAARRAPEKWLAEVEGQGHATETRQPLDARERVEELLMMGLRLAEGVSRRRFEDEARYSFEAAFFAPRLEALCAGGFLVLDGEGLRATAAGRQRLDAVLARLLG